VPLLALPVLTGGQSWWNTLWIVPGSGEKNKGKKKWILMNIFVQVSVGQKLLQLHDTAYQKQKCALRFRLWI